LADAAPRRLPRTQSWDGMGVRGGAGDAGAKGQRSSQIARSDCRRPRGGHWLRGADYRVSRHDAAAHRHPLLRRGGHGRPWDLLPSATSSPALGPNAGRLPRLDRLVVSDGLCARRRFDGGAGAAGKQHAARSATDSSNVSLMEPVEILPAQCVILEEFLPPLELESLIQDTLRRESEFHVSEVTSPGVNGGMADFEHRRSRVLLDIGTHGAALAASVKACLPRILPRLGHETFAVS